MTDVRIILGNGIVIRCEEEDLKETLRDLREAGCYVQSVQR